MNWTEFMGDTVKRVSVYEKEAPETFDGFNTMAKRAKSDGVLGQKTKEFIALGMAVSTRCDSCIGFHVRALVNLGTTRAEMVDALTMITYMGGGPALAYSSKALEAFDEFSA